MIASGGDISAEPLKMGSHPPGKERTVQVKTRRQKEHKVGLESRGPFQ